MKKIFAVSLGCVMLITGLTISLRAEGIKFKAAVQTWFSYTEQNADEGNGYGFTLRRVRLKPYGSLSKKINWTMQLAWDKQTPKLVEVYLDYLHSTGLRFRVGQFTAPGTMSGTLTSSMKLDFLERPMVTEKWSGHNGLSSFRAVGIQVHGDIIDDKLYYAFMIANPETSELFNPGIKSTDYFHADNGVMFWGRLETELTKGLKSGAFFGNGKDTDNNYKRTTYGAHLFYVNKGINFKAEYIAGEYGLDNAETTYNGYYAVLGYKTGKFEPIVRYDCYAPNDGEPDGSGVETYANITVGLNYYHGKNIKFQANYVYRDESMADGLDKIKNNIFYVCFQYTH
jgi:phosphate-selective porin